MVYPAVREWVSFSQQKVHLRSVVLAVGIAAREPSAPLAPFLRPLKRGGNPWGHFHAAVFSYRALRAGEQDLGETVRSLFETQDLLGVLHLLNDDRALSGMGESEFARGSLWSGPLSVEATPRSP